MRKCLYMICPTDYLQPVISARFNGLHYFLTSLGNTIDFDKKMVEQIAALIQQEEIDQISFVIAEENNIIEDALSNQRFDTLPGLKLSYNHLSIYKNLAQNGWPLSQQNAMLLSYFLNKKIKELRLKLDDYLSFQPQINGLLYSKSYDSFKPIYSEVICNNAFTLN